nr:hypothetical protein CFP56_19375 [Quercus suber]
MDAELSPRSVACVRSRYTDIEGMQAKLCGGVPTLRSDPTHNLAIRQCHICDPRQQQIGERTPSGCNAGRVSSYCFGLHCRERTGQTELL